MDDAQPKEHAPNPLVEMTESRKESKRPSSIKTGSSRDEYELPRRKLDRGFSFGSSPRFQPIKPATSSIGPGEYAPVAPAPSSPRLGSPRPSSASGASRKSVGHVRSLSSSMGSSERFTQYRPRTPENVGPGSYEAATKIERSSSPVSFPRSPRFDLSESSPKTHSPTSARTSEKLSKSDDDARKDGKKRGTKSGTFGQSPRFESVRASSPGPIYGTRKDEYSPVKKGPSFPSSPRFVDRRGNYVSPKPGKKKKGEGETEAQVSSHSRSHSSSSSGSSKSSYDRKIKRHRRTGTIGTSPRFGMKRDEFPGPMDYSIPRELDGISPVPSRDSPRNRLDRRASSPSLRRGPTIGKQQRFAEIKPSLGPGETSLPKDVDVKPKIAGPKIGTTVRFTEIPSSPGPLDYSVSDKPKASTVGVTIPRSPRFKEPRYVTPGPTQLDLSHVMDFISRPTKG